MSSCTAMEALRDACRAVPCGFRRLLPHPLSEKELDFLDQERPEVVIIGAGFKGMMQLTPRARDKLSGYRVFALTTDKAIEMMNREERWFAAILHLTC